MYDVMHVYVSWTWRRGLMGRHVPEEDEEEEGAGAGAGAGVAD